MHISRLINEPSNKSITVTFSYDEIRDIANGLYHASAGKEDEDYNPNKYKEAYSKAKFLFDMIKHGFIQSETVQDMHELNNTTANELENKKIADKVRDEYEFFSKRDLVADKNITQILGMILGISEENKEE